MRKLEHPSLTLRVTNTATVNSQSLQLLGMEIILAGNAIELIGVEDLFECAIAL